MWNAQPVKQAVEGGEHAVRVRSAERTSSGSNPLVAFVGLNIGFAPVGFHGRPTENSYVNT
jgi:hypothetical protein